MLAFLVALTAFLGPTPPQPAAPPPVSLERIREELKRPPAIDVDVPVQVPVATFRSRVERRAFVPTFDEWLRKEFALTALQRQSAEWGAKCCGLNLLGLAKRITTSVKKDRQRREVRRIRQQIARDLAQIESAGKK